MLNGIIKPGSYTATLPETVNGQKSTWADYDNSELKLENKVYRHKYDDGGSFKNFIRL